MPSELLRRAYAVLQNRLVDVHPAHPRTTRLDYRSETGALVPPELRGYGRYYFVVRHETEPGDEWKIDVSLWTTDAPRSHLAQLAELERRLTRETRLAILWIKDVWHRLPVYPDEVGGMEVYDAVLEHGARTPDDFDLYLRERGLPAR